MSHRYHLAQVNIARARAPMDHPLMRGFVEQLAPINALAEASPGFVWRLQTEEGDATSIQAFDDPQIIVNLSLWDSLEALRDYVYAGPHLELLKQRKEWMEKVDGPSLALWWLPAGQLPTLEDARRALQSLAERGSTAEAFSFARPFAAPSTQSLPA
ncbi:hypothetical protein PKB_3657 [Pseudomonas knackmussii B13]|uniref:DUF3291 domain-containing protein n=1 Tax=Pseudomonas knackmussii (strain DSM 6978 / CCUG 54928 / LMG 23759 / B13) TaxID=1301098 RepID=A0A024HJD4_PSEKB|nr:DUF3291 domain-containing protein [Pseudomonas knackmussii]CDF84996.1 hypothetical protein PKB_3657 [Pseudomonas knackmussii B13]